MSVDFWTLSAVLAAVFTCLCLWPRYQRLEFEENRASVFVDITNVASVAVNGNCGGARPEPDRL